MGLPHRTGFEDRPPGHGPRRRGGSNLDQLGRSISSRRCSSSCVQCGDAGGQRLGSHQAVRRCPLERSQREPDIREHIRGRPSSGDSTLAHGTCTGTPAPRVAASVAAPEPRLPATIRLGERLDLRPRPRERRVCRSRVSAEGREPRYRTSPPSSTHRLRDRLWGLARRTQPVCHQPARVGQGCPGPPGLAALSLQTPSLRRPLLRAADVVRESLPRSTGECGRPTWRPGSAPCVVDTRLRRQATLGGTRANERDVRHPRPALAFRNRRTGSTPSRRGLDESLYVFA